MAHASGPDPGTGTLLTQTETPVPGPVEPDPSLVTPGLLGLAILLALGVAVVFLYRSMRTQLRKVDFDDGSAAPVPPQDGVDGNGPAR
jgi:hypothetical protein